MIEQRSPEPESDTWRGSVTPDTEPRFLLIGQISRPHGVRGEVRVIVHTDVPERYTWLQEVYVSEDPDAESPRLIAVEGARFHQNSVLLKLAGYDDRNAAETLRSLWLRVPLAEAIPLEEGEYFLYQLEGLAVHSTEGEFLGRLVEVLETRANNVFVVQGPYGELLLPDVAEIIQAIDFETGTMAVALLPGLLPARGDE